MKHSLSIEEIAHNTTLNLYLDVFDLRATTFRPKYPHSTKNSTIVWTSKLSMRIA